MRVVGENGTEVEKGPASGELRVAGWLSRPGLDVLLSRHHPHPLELEHILRHEQRRIHPDTFPSFSSEVTGGRAC